jgi:predicted N-acetyltransferase YhbS
MGPEPTIRPITREELSLPLQWAADEGWNPGLEDAEPFHAADPNGFLMAFLKGQPVGCISVVRYDGGFGFLGLYIVRPEHRGRGFGMRLWRAGMASLDGCVVGLDGVAAQQANYARSGFALAHRNVRYAGRPMTETAAPSARVKPVDAGLTEAVAAYDRRHFPADRARFLDAWLDPRSRKAFAFLDGDLLRGYAVLRACREGFKVGPLFADTQDIAEDLLRAAVAEAAGAPIAIDVPQPNAKAADLATAFGLAPVFETARMYKGPAPDLPLAEIYGVTTLELG